MLAAQAAAILQAQQSCCPNRSQMHTLRSAVSCNLLHPLTWRPASGATLAGVTAGTPPAAPAAAPSPPAACSPAAPSPAAPAAPAAAAPSPAAAPGAAAAVGVGRLGQARVRISKGRRMACTLLKAWVGDEKGRGRRSQPQEWEQQVVGRASSSRAQAADLSHVPNKKRMQFNTGGTPVGGPGPPAAARPSAP